MEHEESKQTTQQRSEVEIKGVEQTTCCIVGGGPAGVLLAYLLARKGVSVTLLEAHMDFEREFRGDTIHPGAMDILDDIGLAERLLQLPHTTMSRFSVQTSKGKTFNLVNLGLLKVKYPYVTVMAQSRFLDFLSQEAQGFPNFHLVMGAQVDELIEENGTIVGVRYRGQDGRYEIRAALTVGADGRFSRVRKLAGFEPIKVAPPMDILWFQLSRREDDLIPPLGGRFRNGSLVALINRFDYWQAGYIIPKGGYQKIRAAGLEHLRQTLARAVPELADRVNELKEWKQISVLAVESSRVARWHRPGLLLIGDAAHVMSPVGGVGINYAIQDAAATANLLTDKLKSGSVKESDLAKVQQRRELPIKLVQGFQSLIQNAVLARALHGDPDKPFEPPLVLKLVTGISFLRWIPSRMIGYGFRPERIKS